MAGKAARPTEDVGSGGGSFAGLMSTALGAAMRGALRGDTQAASRGFALTLLRGLTGQLTRGIGGGAFGGVFGGLIGVGLSLLAGRLLGGGRQQLAPAPIAPLLHFPQLASLDYASNPASRLFGGRAVARGPAFRVEVAYREGAGDIVAAKVATKLGEVNGMNL